MRVAVVGCGGIAYVHLPFILANKKNQLIGVCDSDLTRAGALAEKFQIGNVYGSLTQLLRAQRPDVVHILTPPQTHLKVTLEAVEAGCHVLVEKPMAVSVEEADAMIAAAQARGVKLCVDHNQLFDSVMLKVKRLLARGAVGRVIGLESYYGFNLEQASERRWVDDLPGGLFQDVAPHPFSVILQFLEDPLELHISTLTTGTFGPQIPDEFRVLMKGKNAVGTLTVSFAIEPYLNFLNIYGSEAVLHVDLANMILSTERLRPLPKALARGLMTIEQGMQLSTGAVRNAFGFVLGRIKPYEGMSTLIRAFYDSIEHEHAPPVPGEEGRRIVEVLERIRTAVPAITARRPRNVHKTSARPTIFVTGASGFLGGHLVERLTREGVAVRALVRPTSRIGHLRSLDIDWIDGELGSAEVLKRALDGCEIVFHCAATTHGSWQDYLEGTVRGTEQLFSASEAAGVRRVVYISSLGVYGACQLGGGETVTEDSPLELYPEKRGYYSQSKVEAEKLVLSYIRPQGLPIVVLRPGIIYGPRGKVFFPGIGFSFRNKIFLITGRGDNLLPLTYVENVIDAVCLAGKENRAVGQVFNIVDDQLITGDQYVKELIRRTGIKALKVHVPSGLMYLAASLLETQATLTKRGAFLTRYRLASATKDLRYDTSRAKDLLNWRPNVPLEQGLARTFEWFRSEINR